MNQQLPYSAKQIGERKLYKRVHGQQAACTTGTNVIEFTVPYDHAKITAIEIINGSNLDKCDLEIYFGENKLNQFGFEVNVGKDFYAHKSSFDADLFKDMKIRVTYTSINDKTVGINYILDEVK